MTDKRRATIQLVAPGLLRPTEEIDPDRVSQVEEDLVGSGLWRRPVVAHEDEAFVMDGHHRLAVAHRLGLALMPVVFLNYGDVDVCAWRDGEVVTPQTVFDAVRDGRVLPYKTTRHTPNIAIPACDMALDRLRDPADLRAPQRGTGPCDGSVARPFDPRFDAERSGPRGLRA